MKCFSSSTTALATLKNTQKTTGDYSQILDNIWKKEDGMYASALSIRYCTGVEIQESKVRATTPMDSGYWWVSRASKAVNEHRPAVKRMKNGSSFLG